MWKDMVQKDRRTGTLRVDAGRAGAWYHRARQPAAIALSMAIFVVLLCTQLLPLSVVSTCVAPLLWLTPEHQFLALPCPSSHACIVPGSDDILRIMPGVADWTGAALHHHAGIGALPAGPPPPQACGRVCVRRRAHL